MAESFDPYYKWLGISPQNQPPDLYRLLALERFEADPEVIEAAANRQMAYVQSCAAGPYIEHSQKLLNEIAAARLCLLDARRKAEYDSELRSRLLEVGHGQRAAAVLPAEEESLTGTIRDMDATLVTTREATMPTTGRVVPPPSSARPRAPRPSIAPPPVVQTEGTSVRSPRRLPRKKSTPVALFLILGIAAVAALSAAAYVLTTAGGKQKQEGSLIGSVAGSSKQQPSAPQPPPAAVPTTFVPQHDPRSDVPETGWQEDKPNEGAEPSEPNRVAPTAQNPAEPPADHDELLTAAENALKEGQLDKSTEILNKFAAPQGTPVQKMGYILLRQIRIATSNDEGRRILRSIPNDQFEKFAAGNMMLVLPNLHPSLVRTLNQTLQRVLPEIKKERMPGSPPPGGEPPAANPKAGPPEPALPPGPSNSTEVLQAYGLTRHWDTWVLPKEKRCTDLVAQAKKAKEKQKELTGKIPAADRKVNLQRSRAEIAKKALEAAAKSGSPASGTPEREKLEQTASEHGDEYQAAKEEANQLREDKSSAESEEASALTQARQLAEEIANEYRALAATPEVKTALEDQGQKLGPSDDFKELQAQLGRMPQPRGAR